MKTSIFILLTVGLSFLLYSFSGNQEETFSLTVKVEKLQNSKGVVQFVLYNKEGSIPDEDYKNYYRLEKAKIVNGKSEITFKNLPKGKYAENILQDENYKSKIDKGLIITKVSIAYITFNT